VTDYYAVGGSVRDQIMGVQPHDWDFTVVADSYEDMLHDIQSLADKIFVEKPEYGTVRALVPASFVRSFFDLPSSPRSVPADFVWARKDGYYSDGRRPDETFPGSLYDDLARRDFTMNAMALDSNRLLIDPFGGQQDIADKVINAVGDPVERLLEDALRAVRAIRFSVTKNFWLGRELQHALKHEGVRVALRDNIALDRVREELHKAFAHDPVMVMVVLDVFPRLRMTIFKEMGLGLIPTLKAL
jgi:tRNA nucleotidyltransferase/poly(A) polymerase